MNILRRLLFFFIGFFVTYIIYIFPYVILSHFLIQTNLFDLSTLLLNIPLYLIVILFFKLKPSFKGFKFVIIQGMGVGLITLSISLLALILKLISNLEAIILGLTSFIIILCLIIFSFLKARSVKIKKLKIFSDKIQNEIKVIFISDVHLGSNSEKYLQKIINKIEVIDFDLLLIGGDLVDSSNFNFEELKILKKIKKKIYFVTGNHEYYLDNWFEKSKIFKKFKINNLDNQSSEFNNINFIGISDNISVNDQKRTIKKLTKKKKFNFVIVHKPSVWKYLDDTTDFMISGHTHNGQIFPFNFIVKLKFKNIYGLYERSKSSLYVSSGAGCWGPKMRLGSQNELVLISIQKRN